ncbi:hypothetical protein ACQEMD_004612, partial [Salmonella enterica]
MMTLPEALLTRTVLASPWKTAKARSDHGALPTPLLWVQLLLVPAINAFQEPNPPSTTPLPEVPSPWLVALR